VFLNGKEMNRYVLRFLFDTYGWLATTFVEVLVQCWDTMMRSLEVMKSGFAFEMMSQYAFMQWDPGVTNILMLTLINAHEGCWKRFSSLYSWLNFIHDRGKLWEIPFDARNHKLGATTRFLQVCKQWLIFELI
jgi:hypothetical protein